MQRARLVANRSPDRAARDYNAAAEVWEHHGETDLAAAAEWEAIAIVEKFPAQVEKLLLAERSCDRVAAYNLYKEKERQSRSSNKTLSRRVGHDATIWKRLIRQAKENRTLQRNGPTRAERHEQMEECCCEAHPATFWNQFHGPSNSQDVLACLTV